MTRDSQGRADRIRPGLRYGIGVGLRASRIYWTYAFCPGDKIIQFKAIAAAHEQSPKGQGRGDTGRNPAQFRVGGSVSPRKDKFSFDNQASPGGFVTMRGASADRTIDAKKTPDSRSPAGPGDVDGQLVGG
ncbi:Protein OS-9 [Clavispora lusitaniae]|nr:Protein OS-9 [Clavispora lusitaniae]